MKAETHSQRSFGRYEHLAFELLLAVTVTEVIRQFFSETAFSWIARFIPLLLIVLVGPASRANDPGVGPWRQFLRGLISILVVSIGTALGWRLISSTPWQASAAFAISWFAVLWMRIVGIDLIARRGRRLAQSPAVCRFVDFIGEAAIIGFVALVFVHLLPSYGYSAWLAVVLPVAWVLLRLIGTRLFGRLGNVPTAGLTMALGAAGIGIVVSATGEFHRIHAIATIWTLGIVALWFFIRTRVSLAERWRWLGVVAGCGLLLAGFWRDRLLGGGDSAWYATMMADMLAQSRAGVFPVFIGQSEYQFNGSIYPVRIAPAFHYLGALVDLLTGQCLHPFVVLHLLILGCGIAAGAIGYGALANLFPERRGYAVCLALLWLACPGILSIAYNTDLYMSWTTLPWVPLSLWAVTQTFRRERTSDSVVLGGALGLLWWSHSPIALWMTIIAGLTQILRLWFRPAARSDWRSSLFGAVSFVLIAAYPIGSVLLFPPEPGVNAAGFQVATAASIVHFLREVWPSVWFPVSDNGRALSDFQLGYSLAALLAVALWQWRRCELVARILALLALALLILLNPLPRVSLWLWELVPDFVRNTTSNWAMNRLYLVLASLTIFATASALRSLVTPRINSFTAVLLPFAMFWSAVEASKFARGSITTAATLTNAPSRLQPENTVITRFAYLVFPKLPSNFTDGATDPKLEHRLLDTASLAPETDVAEVAYRQATLAMSTPLKAETANGSSWKTAVPLTLQYGEAYLLALDGLDANHTRGTLILRGPTFERIYGLPEYGGDRAFGAGGDHRPWVALSTSNPAGESINVLYVPAVPALGPPAIPTRLRLLRYDPAALPVRITDWIPYEAEVESPQASWLETPRVFQNGYRATVNGAPAEIRKSTDHLVAVAVPAGTSEVTLRFAAPLGLQALFWLSLLSILGFVANAGQMLYQTWTTRPRFVSPKP